jgi:hypothetical protein
MDELQSLKGLFPEPPPPAEPVVQRHREALMTMIEEASGATAGGRIQPRRGRRAMKLLVVPAVLVLAAAGWTVLRDEATEAAAFACVADGVTSILPNEGTSPIEACRAQWEAGAMVQGVTVAPPLAACVNDSGAVVVIPAESPNACDAANMGEWTGQAEYEAMGSAIRAALVSFHDRFKATGNGCATEQDWRSALADHLGPDHAGWTLEVDQVEAGRRCFGLGSIDPMTMTVRLVGHPGNESIGCDPRTGC